MNKLKLKPDATFKHTVLIPVAGSQEGAAVEFDFKHRGAAEMKAFWEGLDDKQNIDVVMDIAAAWDLQEPFNRENVLIMLDNYPMSGAVVIAAYQDEIFKARVGN